MCSWPPTHPWEDSWRSPPRPGWERPGDMWPDPGLGLAELVSHRHSPATVTLPKSMTWISLFYLFLYTTEHHNGTESWLSWPGSMVTDLTSPESSGSQSRMVRLVPAAGEAPITSHQWGSSFRTVPDSRNLKGKTCFPCFRVPEKEREKTHIISQTKLKHVSCKSTKVN